MDPHLFEMMHGNERKAVKSKLEVDLDAKIDRLIDEIELPQSDNRDLLDDKQRRAKLKLEVKAALKMEELAQQLETATKILANEGNNFLSKEANQKLLEELGDISETSSSLSVLVLDSIFDIAIAKFSQNQFFDCLALFSFLSVLNPKIPDYWLRLGIAAQKLEKNELALRAYEAAMELDPQLIEARLLAVECYIRTRQFEQAKIELEKAKSMTSGQNVDKVWLDLIPILQEKIVNFR